MGAGRLDDPGSDVEAIDLSPMIDEGLIEIVEPTGDEQIYKQL